MSSRDAPPSAPLLLFAENVTALDRDWGRVLCLQLATGQLIGRIQLDMISAENMLIDAGRIFVASNNKVITLDLDGRVLWEQSVAVHVRHTLTGMGIPGAPSIQPDWSRG